MVQRTMSAVNNEEIENGKFHLESFRYAYKRGYLQNMMPDTLDKILTSLLKIVETQQTQINQLQNNLEG